MKAAEPTEKMAPNHRLPTARARLRDAYIAERCRGKNVLHLACVAWPFTEALIRDGGLLHARLAEVAENLAGFDLREAGLEMLRGAGFDNLHRVDLLEKSDFQEAMRKIGFVPDVIVAGEVVEHLDLPGLFLRNCRAVAPAESELLITVPNAFSVRNGLRVFAGYEKVSADHVAYYSPTNVAELVRRADFTLEETVWYHTDSSLHPVERAIDIVLRPLIYFRPQLADGLVARCRPAPVS